jgi:hypothetical protein
MRLLQRYFQQLSLDDDVVPALQAVAQQETLPVAAFVLGAWAPLGSLLRRRPLLGTSSLGRAGRV